MAGRDVSVNPLLHYLNEGRDGHIRPAPNFDPAWYANYYADRIPKGMEPFIHFVVQGRAAGLAPNPEKLKVESEPPVSGGEPAVRPQVFTVEDKSARVKLVENSVSNSFGVVDVAGPLPELKAGASLSRDDVTTILSEVYQPINTALSYRIREFDEHAYVGNFLDVRREIRRGGLISGYHHWLEYGVKEGRAARGGAPLDIPSPLSPEQLLFTHAVSLGHVDVANMALAKYIQSICIDFPNISELFDMFYLEKAVFGIENNKSSVNELPVDFFVMMYYYIICLEMRGASRLDVAGQYLALANNARRYWRLRKDYWAHRIVGWCDIRAAQLLRKERKFDEARAILQQCRRDYWDLSFKYKQREFARPRPDFIVFDRATYELGMTDLVQDRLVEATIHATALANETFGWMRDDLRRSIVTLVGQGLDLIAADRLAEAKQKIADAYVLFERDPGRQMAEMPQRTKEELEEDKKERAYYDIVFYVGDTHSESKRYRVLNVMDSLAALGYRVACFTEPEAPTVMAAIGRVRCLSVFRSPYTKLLCDFLETMRRRGAKILYDIDDLFFDPKVLPMIAGASLMSPEAFADTAQCIEHFRQTLLFTDGATASTSYLVEQIAALGQPARVIPNTVGPLQEKLAVAMLREPAPARDDVRIAYLSGSWTHHQDFAQCESALRALMVKYPQVKLVVVGFIDLGPEWAPLEDRVIRVGFMSHQEMMAFYRNIDISIAALEVGNPYCEAKSQLKVFEAGLFGVPSVASATRPFREAISNGVDGFLATNPQEWYAGLEQLVADASVRTAIGQRARARALADFSSEALKRSVVQIFPPPGDDEDRKQFGLPFNERKMRIVWVVPDIHPGSGGQRNILRFAYYLTTFGHTVSLIVKDASRPSGETLRMINQHFYPFKGTVQNYNGTAPTCDILFATHWSTVDIVLRHRMSAKQACYFVQDFEPGFVPLGSEYLMAENTYRKGLYHITSGPYCERILKKNYSTDADHFKFPLDRLNYWQRPRTEQSSEGTILYFARPEMPRRCYEFGNMMLAEVKMQRPGVRILMYGSNHVDTNHLPFEAVNLGILPTINDLAQIYSNADLGLVFSLTNPSLVPYEMMACGLPVVDVRFQDNITNYGGREDIALLGDPDPSAFASQVLALLDDKAARVERARKGKEFILDFPSEVEAVRRVEGLLLKRIDLIDAQVAAQ
ncbi:hypothetical protein IP70_13455 [alpha proteobacterium AAP38]|nr:hypothetical protein IP70_13455 [alpha proteobacterium AAP38]